MHCGRLADAAIGSASLVGAFYASLSTGERCLTAGLTSIITSSSLARFLYLFQGETMQAFDFYPELRARG